MPGVMEISSRTDLSEILNLSTKPAATSNTYLALSPETPFSLHARIPIVSGPQGEHFFQYE